MNKRKDKINSQPYWDGSFDEQHIRPQRFTSGQAGQVTCTLMDEQGDILCMKHVDANFMKTTTLTTKAGLPVKSKAKVYSS